MFADILLSERILADVLQRAAELTIDRFPYFKVKQEVSEDGSRYVLAENDKPFPVTEKNGYVDFASELANGYLFTVSFFENHLFLQMFHGLSDGKGFLVLLRTLLKTYFELKEGRSFACEGAKDISDAPNEEEWKDPVNCLRPAPSEFHLKKQNYFSFPAEKISNENVKLYNFSVPEQVLVNYAKKNEGGVSGVIALALARAIDCMEIENELPIRIACPMDMRKTLGCSETLRNCTKSSAYTHSVALRSLPYEKQLSVLKGQMMLQASEEYQLPRFLQDRKELEQLSSLPGIEEKKRFFSDVRLKQEPIVSYLGNFDMGELNDRIEHAAIYGKIAGRAGMQNVCLCFKGRCYIYTSYNLKSESYIRMFANEMRDFSNDCSPLVCVDYDAPAEKTLIYKQIKENNIQLSALLFTASTRQVKYALVAVHGFAGHKESIAIQKLFDGIFNRCEDVAVLSFDLPGHGSDEEALSLKNCDAYISAAANYMRRQYPGAELILYGNSFGGYLSLKYISEHPDTFDKAVLRCPAVKMGSTLKKKLLSPDDLVILREGGTVEKGFDMKVKIQQGLLDSLDGNFVFEKDFSEKAENMLIVQGQNDELVDWEDVEEFAKRNNVHLVLSKEADHRFLIGNTMAETIEDCVNFICN